MDSIWTQFTSWWPYGDRWLLTVLLCFGHSVLTLPINIIALILHTWPIKWIDQWKIQGAVAPPQRLVKEVIITTLINHFITTPLFAYFPVWALFTYLNMPIHTDFPSIGKILLDFSVTFVLNDFLFYWAHRTLHSSNFLYKHIHSQHHRFVTPISWACEYAHPIEAIFANTIPTLAGLFVMRSHLFTVCLWLAIRMLETLEAHSGYDLPFSPFRPFASIMLGADGHDWHHSHNRGNYGVSRLWDYLCGTDREYKKWLKEMEEGHENQKDQAKTKSD